MRTDIGVEYAVSLYWAQNNTRQLALSRHNPTCTENTDMFVEQTLPYDSQQ